MDQLDTRGFLKKTFTSKYNSQGTYYKKFPQLDGKENFKKLTDTPDASGNSIKCYVSQNKGYIKYISKDLIVKPYNYNKVITTAASHHGFSGFGNIFVGSDTEVHNRSYIHFRCEDDENPESMLSYLKCKLPNILLSIRKPSQNLTNKAIVSFIPIVPFDSGTVWTDEKVYEYFGLSEEMIEFCQMLDVKY